MRRPRSKETTQQVMWGVLALCCLFALNWITYSTSIETPPSMPQQVNSNFNNNNKQKDKEGFRLISSESFPKSSVAHCTLSTMNDVSWKSSECSYKSLCYNPLEKRMEFYQSIPEITLPLEVDLSGDHTDVFSPHVMVHQHLPLPRLESPNPRAVFLLVKSTSSSTTLKHYLRDHLFAWWLLAQHSVWGNTDGADEFFIFDLNGRESPFPLWFAAVFPATAAAATLVLPRDLSAHQPTCFPRAVAGLGMMTDSCLLPHEFVPQEPPINMRVAVDTIPCSTGRGPLFYALRREMLKTLKVQEEEGKESAGVVLLLEDDAVAAQLMHALSPSVPVRQFKPSLMDMMDPRAVATLFTGKVGVLLVDAHAPQAVGAMFLRPGSCVVLLHDGKEFPDYAYWNNLAYLRVHWATTNYDVLPAVLETEHAKSVELF